MASSSASLSGLLTYFVQPRGSGNGQSQIIDSLRAQDLHPSNATVKKVEHAARVQLLLRPSLHLPLAAYLAAKLSPPFH